MTSLERAADCWREGRTDEAIALAWAALTASPGRAAKHLLSRLLREEPDLLAPQHLDAYRALLSDPDVDPGAISEAGWRALLREPALLGPEHAPDAMAAALEANTLALTLLHENYVANIDCERALTRVRRLLLLTHRWCDFPKLTAALTAQATLNGGAWPFDSEERARLASAGEAALAYLPPRPSAQRAGAFDHAVTRAVAAQYEGWPYPQWRRVSAAEPSTLAARVRKRDPDGPDTVPTPADILIAGCGTGRHTALHALSLPKDRIVSIDISEASLAYARERCAAAGLGHLDFRLLDLHEVDKLGRQFDAILCAGVLHHLPDPEKGWEALARVLKPGGVMQVMVYSRLARMRIKAWRLALGDLAGRPVDDDLLREIRRTLLAHRNAAALVSRDFHTLAGVHDLILHRHEDPFDIARIRRALERLGLQLIRFELPRMKYRAQYRREYPGDPLQRDFDNWTRLELANPALFAGMYDLWCRKPPA